MQCNLEDLSEATGSQHISSVAPFFVVVDLFCIFDAEGTSIDFSMK
jgi:hypothetical protein